MSINVAVLLTPLSLFDRLWLSKCYTRDNITMGTDSTPPSGGFVAFTSQQDANPSVWSDINFSIDVANPEQVENWSFDIFFYEKQDMLPLLVRLYHNFGFIQRFNVDRVKVANFSRTLLESYLDNPYHNCFHAVDTAQVRALTSMSTSMSLTLSRSRSQTVYCMLRKFRCSKYLSSLEMFALLTAAAAHDVNHPGLGNNYHINAQSRLALLCMCID